MKKNYWWRIYLIILSILVLIISYIGSCDYDISRCFWGNKILITRTLVHVFLSILFISPLIFLGLSAYLTLCFMAIRKKKSGVSLDIRKKSTGNFPSVSVNIRKKSCVSVENVSWEKPKNSGNFPEKVLTP